MSTPPLPKPREVPPPQANDPIAVLDRLDDDFKELFRAMAGYTTYHRALQYQQGQLPEGDRIPPMPLWTGKGTVNGKDVVEVVTDFKDLPEEYAPHVLAAFRMVHATKMSAAVKRMKAGVAAVESMVASIVMPTAPQPPGAPNGVSPPT